MKVDHEIPHSVPKSSYLRPKLEYNARRGNYTITVSDGDEINLKVEVSQEELDRVKRGFGLPDADRPAVLKKQKGTQREYLIPTLFE